MIPHPKKINKYSGEPLIYLDHNVLDNLHKGNLPDFLLSLENSDFQVVYSDETLNEVRRSGEKSPVYSNQFLQLLNDLNAAHIKIRLNQDFSPTEELIISTISPFDVYSQHCKGEQIYEDLQASMMLLPFKINGGGVGVSFDDIKREQLRVFDELLEYLDSLASDIEDECPSAAEMIRAQRKTSMQQLTRMLDDTFRQLRENVKNEESWSGLNEFRNAIKLEPYHFNTVQKPHALQQVWEKVKLADSIAENNFTLEEFFGLLKNPIYRELTAA